MRLSKFLKTIDSSVKVNYVELMYDSEFNDIVPVQIVNPIDCKNYNIFKISEINRILTVFITYCNYNKALSLKEKNIKTMMIQSISNFKKYNKEE